MIDSLMGLQSLFIELVNKLFLAPNDIPVISVSPLISFFFECSINTINEISFKLDFGSVIKAIIHLRMIIRPYIPEKEFSHFLFRINKILTNS